LTHFLPKVYIIRGNTVDIMNEEKVLITNQGVMINDNQNSLTVGERGPVLLQDVQFIEKSGGGPNAPL